MTIKQVFHRSQAEENQLYDAIAAIKRAQCATTEQSFITANQAAYMLTRQLIRGRLD